MTTAFKTSLGQAYHLAQVAGDRRSAIVKLKAAIESDPNVKAEALAEKKRLDEFTKSVRGGFGMARTACHVSKVSHDLLTAALT